MLRIFGNLEAIVDSASLFVVMYRVGNIGAPPAAEMNTNVSTPFAAASWARAIAILIRRTLAMSNMLTRISIHKFIRELPITFLWP